MGRLLGVLLGGVLVSVSAPAPVRAQVADADPIVSAEGDLRARTLFDEGRALVEAGENAEAVQRFEQSFALVPRIATGVNLAIALTQVGRLRDAIARFESLRASPELTDEQRADLEARIDDARRALARIQVSVVGVASVEVAIDGEAVGAVQRDTTALFVVDPGAHEVTGRTSDGRTWPPEAVDAAPGREVAIRFDASELPAPTLVSSEETLDRAEPPPRGPREDGGSAGWWVLASVGVAVVVAAAVALVLWLVIDDEPTITDRAVTLGAEW